jgi:trans-2-enoyl-CoA reductase
MSMDVEKRVHGFSYDTLRGLAEANELITQDGEVISVNDATNDDLVLYSIAAQRLRALARIIEDNTHAELAQRVRALGGPVTASGLGTARESISRGSISGISASRIRDALERFAEDDVIPWEAVDNVAPMVPHVTPAKITQYAEDAPASVRDAITPLLPEKRRTIKVEPDN